MFDQGFSFRRTAFAAAAAAVFAGVGVTGYKLGEGEGQQESAAAAEWDAYANGNRQGYLRAQQDMMRPGIVAEFLTACVGNIDIERKVGFVPAGAGRALPFPDGGGAAAGRQSFDFYVNGKLRQTVWVRPGSRELMLAPGDGGAEARSMFGRSRYSATGVMPIDLETRLKNCAAAYKAPQHDLPPPRP